MPSAKYCWDFRTLSKEHGTGDLHSKTVQNTGNASSSITAVIKSDSLDILANANGLQFNNSAWGSENQRVELEGIMTFTEDMTFEYVFKGNFLSWDDWTHIRKHLWVSLFSFKPNGSSSPTNPHISMQKFGLNLTYKTHWSNLWTKAIQPKHGKSYGANTILANQESAEEYIHTLISCTSNGSTIYLNGHKLEGAGRGPTIPSTLDVTTNILGGNSTQGTMSYFKIYDSSLNDTDASSAYTDFLTTSGIDISLDIVPPVVIPEPKLVYDFDFRTLKSISGQSTDGLSLSSTVSGTQTATISGCTASSDGIYMYNSAWGSHSDKINLPPMKFQHNMTLEYVFKWQQHGSNWDTHGQHLWPTLMSFKPDDGNNISIGGRGKSEVLRFNHHYTNIESSFLTEGNISGITQDVFSHVVITSNENTGGQADDIGVIMYIDGVKRGQNVWMKIDNKIHTTNKIGGDDAVIGTLKYLKIYDRDYDASGVKVLYDNYVDPNIRKGLTSTALKKSAINQLGISGTLLDNISFNNIIGGKGDVSGTSIADILRILSERLEDGVPGGKLLDGRASVIKIAFNEHPNMTSFSMSADDLQLENHFKNTDITSVRVVKSGYEFNYSTLTTEGIYIAFDDNQLSRVKLTDEVTLIIKRSDNAITELPFIEYRHTITINDIWVNDWGDHQLANSNIEVEMEVTFKQYTHRKDSSGSQALIGDLNFDKTNKLDYLLPGDKLKITISGVTDSFYFMIGSFHTDVPESAESKAATALVNASVSVATKAVIGLPLSDQTAIIEVANTLINKTSDLKTNLEIFTPSASLTAEGKTSTKRRSINFAQESALTSIKDTLNTASTSVAKAVQRSTIIDNLKTALNLIITSSNVDSIELTADKLVLTGDYLDTDPIVVAKAGTTVTDPIGTDPVNFYSTLSVSGEHVWREYNAGVIDGKSVFAIKIYRNDVSDGSGGYNEHYELSVSGTDVAWSDIGISNTDGYPDWSTRFTASTGAGYLIPGDRINFIGAQNGDTNPIYIIIGSAESGGGAGSDTICFLGDTKVQTDQGLVEIRNLTNKYTILGNRVKKIVKVMNKDNTMVFVCKHALGKNIPNKNTYISRNHGIFINGILIRARDLVNGKTVQEHERKREFIYNVLLDTYAILNVNNMPCESLNPADIMVQKYL